MSETPRSYKARLRARGQVTLPPEVRARLGLRDGDDLVFQVTRSGQIVLEPLRVIDPEQAWFWTERWQKMERETQAEIEAGQILEFDSMEDFIRELEEPGGDAEG